MALKDHVSDIPLSRFIRSRKTHRRTATDFGFARAVKLASNENPIGPSPQGSLPCWPRRRRRCAGYCDGGAFQIRGALAAKRWKVTPDQVILGNGSDKLLADFSHQTFLRQAMRP